MRCSCVFVLVCNIYKQFSIQEFLNYLHWDEYKKASTFKQGTITILKYTVQNCSLAGSIRGTDWLFSKQTAYHQLIYTTAPFLKFKEPRSRCFSRGWYLRRHTTLNSSNGYTSVTLSKKPANRPFYSWPLRDEAAGDLVLIQTALLLLCKSRCPYANKFAFKWEKQRDLYPCNVTSSLTCIQ